MPSSRPEVTIDPSWNKTLPKVSGAFYSRCFKISKTFPRPRGPDSSPSPYSIIKESSLDDFFFVFKALTNVTHFSYHYSVDYFSEVNLSLGDWLPAFSLITCSCGCTIQNSWPSAMMHSFSSTGGFQSTNLVWSECQDENAMSSSALLFLSLNMLRPQLGTLVILIFTIVLRQFDSCGLSAVSRTTM